LKGAPSDCIRTGIFADVFVEQEESNIPSQKTHQIVFEQEYSLMCLFVEIN